MRKKYTVDNAIEETFNGEDVYTKFLTKNDTRNPSNHQYGVLISQTAKSIVRPDLMKKNPKGNIDRLIKIDFYYEKSTTRSGTTKKERCLVTKNKSRFVSYVSSKSGEYRLTGIPEIEEDYVGALFVLIKKNNSFYQAFIFNDDSDIDKYLDTCGGFPLEESYEINDEDSLSKKFVDNLTKKIRANKIPKNDELSRIFLEQIKAVKEKNKFPNAEEMVKKTHEIRNIIDKKFAQSSPDEMLVKGYLTEYVLFRTCETCLYKPLVCARKFRSVGEFIYVANKILNSRRSRAGKSLEEHLRKIFKINKVQFDRQVHNDDGFIPDFIFPSKDAYELAEKEQSLEKRKDIIKKYGIICLSAKTTCRERWKQISDDVHILDEVYLCTLQYNFSKKQLEQMQKKNIKLVIPGLVDENNNNGSVNGDNLQYANKMSLTSFIKKIKEKQSTKCG